MAELNERDLKQRSAGCIGFSMLAHAGLLAVLMLSPRPSAKEIGGSQLAYMEVAGAAGQGDAKAAPAPEPPPAAPPAPETVAVQAPPPPPEQEAVTVPVKQAEIPAATPLPEKKPKARAEKKAKVVKAKAPAEKPKVSEAQVETSDKGDLEVKSAENKTETNVIPEKHQAKKSEASEDVPQPISVTSSDETDDETAPETASAAESSLDEPVAAKVKPQPPTQPQKINKTDVQETKPAEEPAALATEAPKVAQNSGQGQNPSQNQKPAAPAASGSGEDAGKGSAAATTAAAQGAGQAAGASTIPSGAAVRDASKLIPRPGNKAFTYPQQDRLNHREGTAWVTGKVREDGSMTDVALERSSGSKTMDQEAVLTFRTWKFMPGQEGYVRKPVQFVLKGEAQETKATLTR